MGSNIFKCLYRQVDYKQISIPVAPVSKKLIENDTNISFKSNLFFIAGLSKKSPPSKRCSSG